MKFPFGWNKNDLKTKYAPLAAGLAGLTIAGATFAGVAGGAAGEAATAEPAPASDVRLQAMAIPALRGQTAEEQAAAEARVKRLVQEARRADAEAARKKAAEAAEKARKAKQATAERRLLVGSTKASYFWDDGSGRQGDTGLPAYGKPMQKGLFASPSWPLGTEGYIIYKGKKAPFFIGDRGPGIPSSNGVMLDIDGKTFAELTGGTWDPSTLTVRGNGGLGHINVSYVITKWGDGPGRPGRPVPFSTGAYRE
jgi:hypothetical protein